MENIEKKENFTKLSNNLINDFTLLEGIEVLNFYLSNELEEYSAENQAITLQVSNKYIKEKFKRMYILSGIIHQEIQKIKEQYPKNMNLLESLNEK